MMMTSKRHPPKKCTSTKLKRESLLLPAILVLVTTTEQASAFSRVHYHHHASVASLSSLSLSSSSSSSKLMASRAAAGVRVEDDQHFLLKEFSTASGEIVNPYYVLNVPRNAERGQIRTAYRELSKSYHPDGVRFREVLPGKCNNLDDVRAEWERIRVSYEILSNKKTRKRYDRHEFVAYPGEAVARAAMGVAANGAVNMGKILFSVGASTLDLIIGNDDNGIINNNNAYTDIHNNNGNYDDEYNKNNYQQKLLTSSLHRK